MYTDHMSFVSHFVIDNSSLNSSNNRGRRRCLHNFLIRLMHPPYSFLLHPQNKSYN